MGQRASRDFEAALQNPAKCFETPQHVLDDHKLTVTQKRKLLEQWEQDARQLAVAEEEGMGGGEESMLHRVKRAMEAVGPTRGEHGASGSKQGN
ncbi:MAG: hypothetical protein NTY59_10395 [Alphaproteobacteria bacterium]|nr:hypothetical protein [Alphaproteobacteria bacterium]